MAGPSLCHARLLHLNFTTEKYDFLTTVSSLAVPSLCRPRALLSNLTNRKYHEVCRSADASELLPQTSSTLLLDFGTVLNDVFDKNHTNIRQNTRSKQKVQKF